MDTPAVTDAIPDYLTVTTSLAMELVAGLSAPQDIFHRHGIDEDDARMLLTNDAFQGMLKEAAAEWNSENNIEERIRLKAQLALENLLLPMFKVAIDARTPVQSRNDTAKFFERVSGITARNDSGVGTGAKFTLTLNLGEQPRKLEGITIEQGDTVLAE